MQKIVSGSTRELYHVLTWFRVMQVSVGACQSIQGIGTGSHYSGFTDRPAGWGGGRGGLIHNTRFWMNMNFIKRKKTDSLLHMV